MSPLNKEKLSKIRDEKRDRIKKAALHVFARRGIIGTTMRLIAKEAKISLGLSYSYFTSKDELYVELVRDAMEEANQSFHNMEWKTGTPVELLRSITEQMLEESNKQSFLLIQQVQTSDEVPEEAKAIIQQNSSHKWMEQFVPIIIRGQQAGDFCKGDPEKLLYFFFTVITGLMLQEGVEPDIDLLMKIVTK
ncbi:TetR/AcrR family transcriptional regulator [Shimazuella kribbensis]|uniref:TetR/AcrR family transcriptional regulator n=1 Tax=Shimazuella kribbensis TaxID=139808 RepID=UPI0004063779|nr:TetR/AcrR family transcriptional regulator [Shimazuella kribbensis]